MKIETLIYLKQIKTRKITRVHDFTLVKGQIIVWILESIIFPREP